MYYTTTSTSNLNSLFNSGSSDWAAIAFILAVIGSVLIYVLFLKPSKKENNKTLQVIKDFLNFDKMIYEAILKVTYLFLTIFVTLNAFSIISTSFVTFLLTLVFGNLIIRIIYEAAEMLIQLWKNTSEINKKMK